MHRALLVAVFCLSLAGAGADDHARVIFLTQDQAQAALVDESIEPYISRLQPREMATKTGAVVPGASLKEQRQACAQRYRDLARAFSQQEQDEIRALITRIEPALKPFPLFAAQPWSFVKVDHQLEGGLPHTRGRSIVLSDAVLPMLALQGERFTAMMSELLVHEQTHVLQRLNPAPFALLYTKQWGFVRMPHEPVATPRMLTQQLINPDGVDSVWAWPLGSGSTQRLIQPQVQLAPGSGMARMPQDFQEVAREVHLSGKDYVYKMGADGEPETMELTSVPGYAAAFDPADEIFHPNEIAAVLFSRMVVRDLMKDTSPEPPAIAQVRAWAQVELAHVPAHH